MKNIFWATLILWLTGCASAPVSRPPSEYLLTTDRAASAVLNDLRTRLTENKYKINREDADAGIMLLAPRKFSFNLDGAKVPARQTVQMRLEGGSVKIRIAYDCKYDQQYEQCHLDDMAVKSKINRLEPSFLEIVRPVLMKYAGSAESTARAAASAVKDIDEPAAQKAAPAAATAAPTAAPKAAPAEEEINEADWN